MAILGEWSGGTVSILPTTTWSAPASLFPTEDRNDSSAYSFTASTSTLTLPSSGLADGYLIVGAFEFTDTSNGRHNPQARFIQASGTGNFVSGASSGFSRDSSENIAFVRTFGFIDNPSASATVQFQWRRDTDTATGGTTRSQLQVIPLFYSNHGVYSSASTTCTGGTTPTQITGFTADSESDTGAIEIVSNVITLKGDNKKYLALGSSYWEGIGNARTQRWHGFRVDGTMDDVAKGYSYGRNGANSDIGEMFTTIVSRVTTDITVDQFIYRGETVGTFPNTGGSVDGNVTGTNPNHVTVILELNDSAETFLSHSTTQQVIDVAGVRVDLQIADVLDNNDSASFTSPSSTVINAEVANDMLLGSNVGGGYASSSTARYTGYAEFTINGTGENLSFAGDYGRGSQGGQDCWGWSANLMSVVSPAINDDLGVNAGKITGGEGGTVNTIADWVGFWGVNLDTLASSGTVDNLFSESIESASETSTPTMGQEHSLLSDNVESLSEVTNPTVSESHALNSDSVESASEVTTPSIGQAHALISNDTESTSEVSNPVIGIVAEPAFSVSGFSILAFDELAFSFNDAGNVDNLLSDNIESASETSNPNIGQAHDLISVDAESNSETSNPVFGQGHNLNVVSIESASEVSNPELAEIHALLTDSVESASETSTPTLAQVHVLIPNNIESNSEVSNPTLTENAPDVDNLLSENVESPSETSEPLLAQVHNLIPIAVDSASEVTTPSLATIHALISNSVESNSEVSEPTLGVVYELFSDDVESTSEVSIPTLTTSEPVKPDILIQNVVYARVDNPSITRVSPKSLISRVDTAKRVQTVNSNSGVARTTRSIKTSVVLPRGSRK